MFAPYVMDGSLFTNGSPTGKICEEAASIILDLMKHHHGWAGETEPSGFMRSFKDASIEFLSLYNNRI